MATSRPLYSVNGEGEVTQPPPPASGTTKQPSKIRPKFPVPTDRMKFSTGTDIVRAFVTLSRGGVEPVNSAMLAANLNIAAVTVGLNNMFFKDVGLIKMSSKGCYLPTDVSIKFAQKYSFDQEVAARLLADTFANTWFYKAVKDKFEITSDATRSQVIETLAAVAETDSSYNAQYGQLLEWLTFVGLITMDGEVVRVVGATPVGAPDAAPVGDGLAATPPVAPVAPVTPQREEPTIHQGTSVPVVALSFDISLTADDLTLLNAEQIAAVFEGIGKVAAVKPTVEAMLHKN